MKFKTILGVSVQNELRPLDFGGKECKNVAMHTREVLNHLNELGASDRLLLAGLCHDLGKKSTKKVENGRITYKNHENVGAKYVRTLSKKYGVESSILSYCEVLVRMHMRPFALINSQVTNNAFINLANDAGEYVFDLIDLACADCTDNNFKSNRHKFHRAKKHMVELLYAKEGLSVKEFRAKYGLKYSYVAGL